MKNSFALFFFLTIINNSFAQLNQREWQFRAGVVSARIVSPSQGSTNAILKYTLGIFSEQRNSENAWSLLTGIELKGKGKGVNKKSQFQYKEQLDLQYLNFASFTKLNIKKAYFCVGVFVGYLTYAENSLPVSSGRQVFNPNEVNKIDAGLIAGGGYRFFNLLDFGITYDHSLTNMYKRKIYGANLSSAYVYSRNRAISLYAGAIFKF